MSRAFLQYSFDSYATNEIFIFSHTVLQSTSQGNGSTKAIRIATQSLVRPHIRNITSASQQQQPPQQQQSSQPKTLVLKTIPLKVKQVAPTTIKMPSRQTNQGPHNVVHQQPTEVRSILCERCTCHKKKM